MAKFTFINEESSYMGNCKTTTEFSAVHIDDVLERFEDFLKGAGFVFDGHLEVVNHNRYGDEMYTDVNKDLNDYRLSEQEEIDIRN